MTLAGWESDVRAAERVVEYKRLAVVAVAEAWAKHDDLRASDKLETAVLELAKAREALAELLKKGPT